MKFGKEYASQMVLEWQPAYMDYNFLKKLLKDILVYRKKYESKTVEVSRKGSLKRRLSLYRAFSGLTNRYNHSPRTSPNDHEDEVILVSAVDAEEGSEGSYQTLFLMSSEEGGEYELLFFRRLDDEFNKVVKFYKEKMLEMNNEAEELSKQMDALIALRIRVNNPLQEFHGVHVENLAPNDNTFPASAIGKQGVAHMEMIQEVEMSSEGILKDESRGGDDSINHAKKKADQKKAGDEDFRPAPLEILDRVRINIEPETPISTLRNVLKLSSDLSFSKEELRNAEERLRQAFIEFYQKLRLLKNFSFLNQLAFSKIMKKYDKITSRNASKSYLMMVDNSQLGSSDEVSRLIEKVEATYIKHFSNGNRRKGMKYLRPEAKKERHRVTFSFGLFTGCSIALLIAIIVILRARNHLESEACDIPKNNGGNDLGNVGKDKYMRTIFPLYSLFGYIVLHLLMYAGEIYFWRRFRVNYPFIFGFKHGTELGYRKVLLIASALSVLALAATMSNLDMEMDPSTKSFKTLTELVPLGLLIAVLLILFCPFNIMYHSSRFFFIRCAWHCICAPLYKVNLPDFFLADQLTSQVQAIRCLLFYVCYYGWGDFKHRSHNFENDNLYKILNIIVAIIPFWARFLQCVRRFFEEKDSMQGLNSLKYFSTIVALVMRTCYSHWGGTTLKILAAVSSGLTTIVNTYWDVVLDWGLLRTDSRNRWLRDKLLVPNKAVYFAAIVINILLRLVWMQLVLDFNETSFLHKTAFTAIVASLEIIRRGIWNFFRLENEQLNNVGKYRAFKSVPLPFNYDDDDHSL